VKKENRSASMRRSSQCEREPWGVILFGGNGGEKGAFNLEIRGNKLYLAFPPGNAGERDGGRKERSYLLLLTDTERKRESARTGGEQLCVRLTKRKGAQIFSIRFGRTSAKKGTEGDLLQGKKDRSKKILSIRETQMSIERFAKQHRGFRQKNESDLTVGSAVLPELS